MTSFSSTLQSPRFLQEGREGLSLTSTPLRGLLSRAPVSVAPDCPIREAAQLMASQRISSLLVVEDERCVGIVTDRDLRTRVVAAGSSYELPLSEVMTPAPITLDAEDDVLEALLLMTQQHIHHLPVVSEGKLIGLVTATDLLRQQSASPVFLAHDIAKQGSREGLERLMKGWPQILVRFVDAGTNPEGIGRILSSVTDALNQRLLTLAHEQLGPPPFAYAWVVLGSQARRTPSVASDQDHAMILSATPNEEERRYFAQLAQWVSDGLHQAGIPYCSGQVMATNPKWCVSLSDWQGLFRQWMSEPAPEALLHSSIFFDMRALYDPEGLVQVLRTSVMEQAPKEQVFLAQMARNAMGFRPPLGWFRQFALASKGPNKGTFDIKAGGLAPVVDLVRVYSLAEGLLEVGTCQRIRALRERGAMQPDDAKSLLQAFGLVLNLRYRLHALCHREQRTPTNAISPKQMSSFERGHLREAFKLIKSAQEALGARYSVGMLG